MKKFYLGLAVMLLSPYAVSAVSGPAVNASSVALDFYNSLPAQSNQGSVTKAPKARITDADLIKVNLPTGNLEVFNVKGNRGFILVNPDGENYRIIGYSDKGGFDASNLPPQLKKALEQPVAIKAGYARGNAPSPVVLYQTAEWGQNAPYNDLCPTVDGEKAPAGCVATAMAIAMKYHNWPDCTRGGEETDYYFPEERFDFDNYTINWDALDNKDNPAFAAQAAQLAYSAGVASQMMYGAWESGAEVWPLGHLLQYFYAYDKDCQYLPRDKFDDSQWDAMLRAQLDEVGPVIYNGFGSGGHCFVVDGYNSDGMYHVNWGWDGGSNGYYSLDFSIDGGMSFGEAQGMVINIKPDREKKQYSKAWIPNAEVYIEGAYGCNGWNFSSPDILPDKQIDFRSPAICIGSFRGYIRVAIADSDDNIVDFSDCFLIFDGYRYFCPDPGSDLRIYNGMLPAIKDGQHYQLVAQEVPNANSGPNTLETGYSPLYPPTDNPDDWSLVLGGIVYPSYFYQTGNRSEIIEVRFHIDESMPAYCIIDNTFEHEFTKYCLKGTDAAQNIVLPRKGVTLEVKAYDKEGNPCDALYVGAEDEYRDNIMMMSVSPYNDQADVYIKYQYDGDTRKDSELQPDEIVEQDGLVYKIENDALTVIGYDKVGDTVTIPESIVVDGNELLVASVASEALMFAPIKHLVIECKDLEVSRLAFAGMDKLESVSADKININSSAWAVAFVKSGLKNVYLNDVADNSSIMSTVTGNVYYLDKLAVAVEDVDFILTDLPDSDPLECFNVLYDFSVQFPDDKIGDAFGSYVIPGISTEDLSQYIGGLKVNVRQMWTYEIDKYSCVVRIGNVMENVEIESVLINGVEATANAAGIYSTGTSSQEEGMTVTVNYTINGIKKTAVYSADLNNNIVDSDLHTMAGDLSGDGKLDMTDANILKDHIEAHTTDSLDPSVTDMNRDGRIDMTDVNYIKDLILKLEK